MKEKDFETALQEILEQVEDCDDIYSELKDIGIASVSSYSDEGILTKNKGLVVKLKSGSKFHITIVKEE